MLEVVTKEANAAIAARAFPGCVIGVVRSNGEREIKVFGKLTYESNGEDVTKDTVYDLASVTKSIPVASIALTMIAEGKLQLLDPVKKYIPELENNHGATIEDLLRYRVQGPRMSELAARFSTFEQIRTHIFETGFNAPPRESIYTNLPAFILGMVLERVGGAMLPTLAHQYFFGPLEMNHTTFFPSVSDCAPTEIVDGEEIRGIPHDESARVFARARRAVGHAGLFSTAGDLLNFLEALLKGKLPTVANGAQKGLGWQLSDPRFMSEKCGPHTFGKTGFTGTSVVCDIDRGIAFVILSNRTYPTRPLDDSAMYAFRAAVAESFLS